MTRLATAEFRALVYATLHELSTDGEICSIARWNSERPEILPKSSGVTGRLGFVFWREVAAWAGLAMAGNRSGNHRNTAPEPRYKRDPRSVVTQALPQPNAATGIIRAYVRRGWR